MAGLMRPTEGKVLWKNEDIYLMSDDELTSWRGKNIWIFISKYSDVECVDSTWKFDVCAWIGNDKSIDVEIDACRFGLKEVAESLPGRLSGGQKRRAMIASVLVRKPKII